MEIFSGRLIDLFSVSYANDSDDQLFIFDLKNYPVLLHSQPEFTPVFTLECFDIIL